MSWQVAAFGLLGVGLTGGFVWYERTRPDARIVALVATLAALGALGRIAFAAVPNVKPTTDIVLVAGYALGGAPGFVTGAVAALTSNFFFGQGPWTPWQMAGWGATGILGAGLARLTGGRIGRWPLAAVCFVVGLAFTALQDAGDWVTYSDHSLAQLGVYVGQGVGFDLVHAIGCLLFALAFGPALLRSVARFRLRLAVRWLAPAVLAAVLIPTVPALLSGPGRARAAATPIGYLLGAENPDGGFGPAPRSPSTSLDTGWAVLALAAGGAERPGAVAYVERNPGGDPGSLERSILAIRAGGGSVSGLVGRLAGDIGRDGSVSGQTNLTAFAVLALRAAGVTPPSRTVAWLARQQDGDGGFNFATAGGQSDVDDTGAVLEALAGTPDAGGIARAVAYLRARQLRDGGFPSTPGSGANAQSTAFAVQGLLAAGATAQAARGQAYLRSLIAPDGHVAYAPGQNLTPVWVTAQAELALSGRPLPLAAPATAPPTAQPGPVAAQPPARKPRPTAPPRRPHRRAARTVAHPVSRGTPLGGLAADAGALAALALAPLDV